ncbi:MAG: DUF58 domain-containing protein [Desulfomonile sp.]|nr:DUF58 domain-containing protein [Desulfomonile sp.]
MRLRNGIHIRVRLGGWICVFLLVWVLAAAVVTGNNFLFIIFGMVVGLLAVSHRLAGANLKAVRCIRKFPEEIYAQTKFNLGYTIKSERSKWGAFTLTVREQLPLEAEADGASVVRVRPGESISSAAVYSIGTRGDKIVKAGVVSSAFPFGFATYSRECCPSEPILVFPRIEPIDDYVLISPLGTGSTVEHVGPFGSVPYTFRDYVPGDPYKFIDWKKTAQTGELITRVLADEGSREVAIRLPLDASERAISRAASLVVHFAGRGAPVSLHGPGVYVPAGVGKEVMLRTLTILARWGGPVGHSTERVDTGGMTVDVAATGEFAWRQGGGAV